MEGRLVELAQKRDRTLVTLVGIPGSGKSTVAKHIAQKLNSLGISCAVVGMDGYHYTRAHLADLIGIEKAIKYRGAPYTFDAKAVVELAKELSTNLQDIYFNTFDHAVKDPVVNGGKVPKGTKVIIFEGLYLHLKDEEWRGIMDAADDTFFLHVDRQVARDRLARRHLESGIVNTLNEGYKRADTNDLPNGDYIVQNSYKANHTIEQLDLTHSQ